MKKLIYFVLFCSLVFLAGCTYDSCTVEPSNELKNVLKTHNYGAGNNNWNKLQMTR